MTISVSSAERVHVLFEAAKRNGSLISLQEILPLLPERVSERELMEAIKSAPSLNSRFELKSGFVTEKAANREDTIDLSSERRSRRRAAANMLYARRFVPLLRSGSMKLAAVSGSTSYRSASRSDDLDLFCVTAPGKLWIFLAKSLLLSRAFRMANPESPPICLSCVLDGDFADSMFAETKNALFARDALETVILEGEDAYQNLLEKGRWIERFYPGLYASRIRGPGRAHVSAARPSKPVVLLNRLLFVAVGAYVGLKSWILNRRLAAVGRPGDAFRLLKGADHLIYESNRYRELGQTYGNANTRSSSVQIR